MFDEVVQIRRATLGPDRTIVGEALFAQTIVCLKLREAAVAFAGRFVSVKSLRASIASPSMGGRSTIDEEITAQSLLRLIKSIPEDDGVEGDDNDNFGFLRTSQFGNEVTLDPHQEGISPREYVSKAVEIVIDLLSMMAAALEGAGARPDNDAATFYRDLGRRIRSGEMDGVIGSEEAAGALFRVGMELHVLDRDTDALRCHNGAISIRVLLYVAQALSASALLGGRRTSREDRAEDCSTLIKEVMEVRMTRMGPLDPSVAEVANALGALYLKERIFEGAIGEMTLCLCSLFPFFLMAEACWFLVVISLMVPN